MPSAHGTLYLRVDSPDHADEDPCSAEYTTNFTNATHFPSYESASQAAARFQGVDGVSGDVVMVATPEALYRLTQGFKATR